MERIGLLGASLTDADAAGVEALKRSGLAPDELLRQLADALAASELVVIETCNRVEVVYAREAGLPPARVDAEIARRLLGGARDEGAGTDAPTLHFLSGRNAARHLFRVAASLDSLVQGEDQILGQLRDAHARAEEAGMVGPLLGLLFEQAFQAGKQVRTRTDLSRHPVSVMSLGVHALADELATRANGHPPRIALIGAGETARHAAKALGAAGLGPHLVVNRTMTRAGELARRHGARAVELAEFLRDPEPVDALVAATGSPEVVLGRSELRDLASRAPAGRGLVALDLASPHDLEPGAAGDGYLVIDLEALREAAERNRGLRAAAAARAEGLVQERLASFERRAAESRAAERIEGWVSESRELIDRELARLAEQELPGLGPAELARVERWARTTFGRVAHISTRACKELARGIPRTIDGDEEETTG